ncbi:MAG: serine/threonine-protein kinase [Ignavibacterium sp.]|jgi:serine/threonine-protein kinase|nr:serine/threonine-protein kinase [Ignavibacterium sp.]
MDKNIWTDIKTIFYKAVDLDGKERESYLNEVCKTPELKKEILTLIFAHDNSENFLEDSIITYQPVEDNTNLFIGKTFGKYKIEKLIARGGMGLVYLGLRDDAVKQNAAVKIINPGVASGIVIKRFQNERQTLANLNHPNISRLLDGGITEDGIQYLVMEYIDGIPIDEYCDKQKLNIKDRLNLFLKVAAVAQYAHQNLVVHRDLKPSNILITRDGEPKLLDFGIAKFLSPEGERFETVTQRGMWNLTPEFASPEQIKGEKITTASDVYSLGIVLYKLLTGHSPYKIKSFFHSDINKIITQSEPTKPSEIIFETIAEESEENKSEINAQTISITREGSIDKLHKILIGDLDNIISMAIRKEPEGRYSSVDHFADDIKRYLDDKPVSARPDSFSYRTKKFIKRNRNILIPAAIIFIIINLGLAGILWQGYIAAKERDTAKLEADKSNRIKSFLLEMISSPDPLKDGSEVKVVDVITEASQKLSKELSNYPEIEAEIRTMLANTYQNLGVYDSALSELIKADQIIRKFYGEKSKETSLSIKSLALTYHYKGDYQKAEDLFKKSLAMLSEVEKEPTFERAMLIDAYGTLLADMGNYEESKKLTEEALKIAESLRGSDDPQVAEIKNNLATSYNYLNKLDEAEKLYNESLLVFRKHFGNYHLRVSSVINNIAFIHIFKEEHQQAIPLLLESLNIKLKVLGQYHPDLILAYSNIGSTYFNINDFTNAEKFMRESINVGLKNYDADNINLSRSYMWYGRILDAEKNYGESIHYLNKAYLIRKNELGEENKMTLICQSLLGQTQLNAGNYSEAEKHLVESYNGLKEVLEIKNEATQKTLSSIIELYEKLGKTEKVKVYSKLISEKKLIE